MSRIYKEGMIQATVQYARKSLLTKSPSAAGPAGSKQKSIYVILAKKPKKKAISSDYFPDPQD